MTNSETVLVFALILTEHERFDASEEKARLWATMLQDVPYKAVELATMTVLTKSAFPPKLSDIMKALEDITSPDNLKITGSEAWGEVTRLMSSYGLRPYDPPEELEKALNVLSPLTKKIVKQIGYRNICICEEETLGVVRGQFLKMFESQKTRERDERLIPASLQKQIQGLVKGMSMKFIGDGE